MSSGVSRHLFARFVTQQTVKAYTALAQCNVQCLFFFCDVGKLPSADNAASGFFVAASGGGLFILGAAFVRRAMFHVASTVEMPLAPAIYCRKIASVSLRAMLCPSKVQCPDIDLPRLRT